MRALWLEPDESFLAERRRLGHDKKDEVWDGVLHMVPPPSGSHEAVVAELVFALKPHADRLGLTMRFATTGLFDSERNYRIPDVSLVRAEHLSRRGLEGAELVVEVLSPDDESRDKLSFFAARGIREVWFVDPKTRSCEMLMLINDAYVPIADGRSIVLGIEFPI